MNGPPSASSRRPGARLDRWRIMYSRTRVVSVFVIGVVAAVVSAFFMSPTFAVTIGWAVATSVFTGWVWFTIAGMDATQTRTHATREDPSRPVTDVILLAATVISLVDVGFVLARANSVDGAEQGWLAGLGVGSVVLSWVVVHTLYTLRYAMLYYSGPNGGIQFNQDEDPRYSDFAYVAFTLGMTFQVSDTNITNRQVRATVLRHSLLSYLFGSVILATTINLIVSLSSGSK